jgi:hypothetical protein
VQKQHGGEKGRVPTIDFVQRRHLRESQRGDLRPQQHRGHSPLPCFQPRRLQHPFVQGLFLLLLHWRSEPDLRVSQWTGIYLRKEISYEKFLQLFLLIS